MSLDTDAVTKQYVYEFCRSLNCPRALTVWLLFKYEEHDQLVSLEVNPLDYDREIGSSFRDSLAATKLLSKATFLKTSFNLKEEARKTFLKAEQVCKETNRRIIRGSYSDPRTHSVILTACRKINFVLTPFSANEFVDSCDWGPGASVLVKRREATGPNKYLIDSSITSRALNFIQPWFHAAYPLWFERIVKERGFRTVAGNKVVTVPKNAKTDRTIAIEPGLNLWFQKGIGTMIRRRLSRVGIDLNRGQDHHGRLANLGSKTNHLATVDFSCASDTIAKELIPELVCGEWLHLLQAFRSSTGVLDTGEEFSYEKFSSMGNGYTFELESLIFWAIAAACCDILGIEGSVSTYGDDVILPAGAFDMYVSVTKDLGFEVNVKKSYSTSYYRESCGSHYYYGDNVKPIYQKEPLNDKTAVLKAANSVRRLSHRHGYFGCDKRFLRCWQFLSRILGPKVPRISEGYGDLGLVCNIDEAGPVVRARFGLEGFYVRIWAAIARREIVEHEGLLLFRLKSIGGSDTSTSLAFGNEVPLPLRTNHSRTRMLVHRWVDLGDWV